jgi:hypothetical protein
MNSTVLTPISWNDTQITVVIPSGTPYGVVALRPTVNGQQSIGAFNFTVGTPPVVYSGSPYYGLPGTNVTVTGTNFGTTQGSSTFTMGSTQLTPTSWSDTAITVTIPAGTPNGVVYLRPTVNGLASIGAFTFTVGIAPVINGGSPYNGPTGTVVAVNGINFGATQGSSTFKVGSTTVTPLSWSDTQIAVAIPTGTPSGLVYLRPTVNGLQSIGAFGFTVTAPPTITASASPAANSNGWNNSAVTVSFTCTAGSAAISTCTSPVTVNADGQGQVISGTATDTAGQSANTSVTVNLDSTAPDVAITSHADGASLTIPDITVAGNFGDSLSGVSTVTCNGNAAALSSGTFSCPMTLTTKTNPLLVQATDLAGNLASVQISLILTGAALPPPQSILLTPDTMAILVGEERDLEVVDEQGRPRGGATWSVTPSNVAEVSTSTGRPMLKGLAAGLATVVANLQGFTAQATVNVFAGVSLPAGTVRWSVTPTLGFATTKILQAQPAKNAPDLYAVENGPAGETLVRAFDITGRQQWQAMPSPTGSDALVTAVSDTQGGLLMHFQDSTFAKYVKMLHPTTGQQVWRYDSPGEVESTWAIHPDGTIFVVETTSGTRSVLGLNGATGQVKFRVDLPASIGQTVNTDCLPGQTFGGPYPSTVGLPSVLEDGAAYLQVAVSRSIFDYLPCGTGSVVEDTRTLQLWKVQTDGTASMQVLKTYSGGTAGATPGEVIPDGSGGALASWTATDTSTSQARVTRITSTGSNEYPLPFSLAGTMVLGENGVAFATDGQIVTSFDLATGASNWSWSWAQAFIKIIMSTTGNGLVVTNLDFQTNMETVAQLDNLGQPTFELWNSASLQYAIGGSWFGTGAAALLVGPEPNWPSTTWPDNAAEAPRSSKGKINILVSKVDDILTTNFTILHWVNTGLAYWQHKAGILFSWDGTIIPVPKCAPDRPSCSSSPDDPLNIREISNVDNATEILRRFRRSTGVDFVFVHSVYGSTRQSGVPAETDTQTGKRSFTNVVISGSEPIEFVSAHELGHVFQLEHNTNAFTGPYNLMCGELVMLCPEQPSESIRLDQLRKAQKSAVRLKE